jgi:hypothetical protein
MIAAKAIQTLFFLLTVFVLLGATVDATLADADTVDADFTPSKGTFHSIDTKMSVRWLFFCRIGLKPYLEKILNFFFLF